jgi:predicted nuclease with TOPRIM domain
MSSVKDLLLSQREVLNQKLKPLVEERSKLRNRVMDLSDEIAVLGEEIQQVESALRAVSEGQSKSGHVTIMDAVLEVLENKPEGMTAQEILAEINVRYFDGRIVRASLSPQLSRLKDRDKKLKLRGTKWIRLPDQISLFRAGEPKS